MSDLRPWDPTLDRPMSYDEARAEVRAHAQSDNPKNLAARSRVKIALLPAAGVLHGAHAAGFGAAKYGPYNWREKKIALMEYASAIMRHVQAWVDGEDDSPGEAHHLGHVIAGASIMLDAIESGTAIDDRPLPGTASDIQRRLAKSGNSAETAKPSQNESPLGTLSINREEFFRS